MRRPGLDRDGFIEREGDLARVPAEFAPVVEAVTAEVTAAFGPAAADGGGLHSVYLYGSIPRGTAVPGVSDLDVLLALHHEPAPAEQADATAIEQTLDSQFPQINGAGILLSSTSTLLSELERYDMGWFVACLCTPLLGDDLGRQLPRYRPTSLLARETNGDLDDALALWRRQLGEADPAADRHRLSRLASRRIVRTGFTLVMPRWSGWTSDLRESATVFGQYYPERREQMRTAAETARTPTASEPVLTMMITDLGPWLATEYLRVHGRKTPRTSRGPAGSAPGWKTTGGPGARRPPWPG